MQAISGNIGRHAAPQLKGQIPEALPTISGGPLGVRGKLAVLADAAKYDASCSSSGTSSRNSMGGKGIGSSEGSGICHAYAPDGRCISLLKILLTNYCKYDCLYCVNRVSSNVQRARFTVDEVVQLTLDFYKRNYIEGLFLSSGIMRDPDYTMEQVVEVARVLREVHDFRGYIHLKTIPEASPDLLARAGLYADRLSINIELPTQSGLTDLAPEKNRDGIKQTMARVKTRLDEAKDEKKRFRHAPKFAPAGQSTQMIVGADDARDRDVLGTSSNLYGSYGLKRVYYSAFSPIPDASSRLPLIRPPLMREHRLYQADWLLRFYGFGVDEITSAAPSGNLDLAIDPKLAWALANRHMFPVDVNKAQRSLLLRVPGLGTTAVKRILTGRRHRSLRLEDLARMSNGVKKAMPFICAHDWQPGGLTDSENLRDRFAPPPEQLVLF
ncbi:putative DNA modification/repair radical SAM protein [Ahrensia sp. R2A130]|uniref:putative DNA modification/repair radical SAM protein n=1 Tax=Ahrensia sp. R2A130 TaxID=744979 RepID=UPI0001E0B4B8|nr:putative DNA modification/repair radical SAM protein [Ahrensia sp. R2A130]EFL89749.1 radical SAM family protein [Ahrensia sp. R2A130]